MSTHSGRAYLNTCIKVPIDPCNNCPAPVYNRPRICMGKKQKAQEEQKETPATTWTSQTGIRPLAKFYDSIPDYCEVKHLHQAEFYSTLESLRSTSRELSAARCASASSSSLGKKRNGKGKIKKKPALLLPPATPTARVSPAPPPSSSCSLSEEYDKCLRDLSRLKSFKQDFAIEVADFKRSLKQFEEEFQRPRPAPTTAAPKHTAERAKCRREKLRRSLSVNDLGEIKDPAPPALSIYFPTPKEVPQIHIESPSVSSSKLSSSRGRGRRRKTTKTLAEKPPTPIRIFGLEREELELPKRTASVSPLHPVARPNLAATLRAEVSRKKVKELKNNCTYHDPRPPFDWEVRKTPAWKSLSLNESHQALLSIRLATRKAEQALQERQYELHMEMMRQRVKSAPLLLEGPTFWGPEVGKLSHNCRSEGMRHACDTKQRSKKKSSGNTSCSESEAKLQQLRKIYGSEKSCQSRQSARSKRSAGRRTRQQETPSSGDDLCSVDRAFL